MIDQKNRRPQRYHAGKNTPLFDLAILQEISKELRVKSYKNKLGYYASGIFPRKGISNSGPKLYYEAIAFFVDTQVSKNVFLPALLLTI